MVRLGPYFREQQSKSPRGDARMAISAAFVQLSGNTVSDSAEIGTEVGTLSIIDGPEYTGTPVWSLTNDAGGRFTVDETTGVITVAGTLDFDEAQSHRINVKVRGTEPGVVSPSFAISVSEGGGGGEYVAKAVQFGGSTFLLNEALSWVDGPYFLISVWLNIDSPIVDGQVPTVFVVDPLGVGSGVAYQNSVVLSSSVLFGPSFANSDGSSSLSFETSIPQTNIIPGTWGHSLAVLYTDADEGLKVGAVYGDGIKLPNVSYGDIGSAFVAAFNGNPLYIGADTFDDDWLIGGMADLFMMPLNSVDIDESGNISAEIIRLFIDENGRPVNPMVAIAALGAPPVMLSGDADTFASNSFGTGGSFAITGTLSNAATSPSD